MTLLNNIEKNALQKFITIKGRAVDLDISIGIVGMHGATIVFLGNILSNGLRRCEEACRRSNPVKRAK